MKSTGRVLGTLCIILLACAATGSWAALTASLDRDRAALGDTLRLTITATDDEELSDLDLGPLQNDFEVLGRSSSSKTSYINGKFSSTKELLLDITPRREGSLAIPPLRVGKQATNALPVLVGPPPRGSTGDQDIVFEAELDRSSVYVQGQVILTLRLQQAINLDDRNITQLQLDNAFVRPLEQSSFQRTVNGRPWLVHELRYAIFPEQSGTLEIPAQTFSASERAPRRSFFDIGSGGRQVRRSTAPLTVEVLPRPDSYPDADWLPAAALTLEESWSTPPEQLQVGESATRTITIRGEGLQGAQLPPLMFPSTQGLKYYPDQPVISDGESASGLVGTRVDSVAVVPTQAGHWVIPELRIPWWDTGTNQLRYAVLPARDLEATGASPAANAAAPAPLPAPALSLEPGTSVPIPVVGSEANPLWRVIAVVNGLGWLLTLIYVGWRRFRRPRTQAASSGDTREQPCFKALLNACASGNARQARKAVIEWTAVLTGQPALASLVQVCAEFNDPDMDAALAALNAVLYGSEPSSWDGTALADSARRLRSTRRRSSGSREIPLRLYPEIN